MAHFFSISYYFGTLNRKMSYFLNICISISHVVISGGKNGFSFDVTYLWVHDPNKFCLDFLWLLCQMAKTKFFKWPKLSPFFAHYGDH